MKNLVAIFKCIQRIKSAMAFIITGGFGILLCAPTFAQTEKEPIVIEITSPQENATVDTFVCTVKGKATSLRPLDLLAINHQQLDIAANNSNSRQLYFDRKVPLLSGQNIIEIIARDNTGNSVVKSIHIVVENKTVDQYKYKAPDEDEFRLKLPIAVLGKSNEYRNLAIPVLLESELGQLKRFHVLERAETDRILQELQLSASAFDGEGAVWFGKLTSAVFVVQLEYAALGSELSILASIVDTASGKIFATADTLCDPAESKNIQSAVARLASQIQVLFPKVNGFVTSVRGDQVVIKVGGTGNVRLGTHVLILKTEVEDDELTGDPLQTMILVLGRGRVTQINQPSAICTLTWKEADITPGMLAVTW